MKRKVFLSSIMMMVLTLIIPVPIMADEPTTTTVPITGFIGLDDGTDIEIPDDLIIDITVPGKFTWVATDETNGDVVSPEYSIRNDSKNVALRVTFLSFTPTNDAAKNLDGLVLGLTGDIAQENIVGYINEDKTPYTTLLGTESAWKFMFNGKYDGLFPVPALQPTYNMVFNFEVAGLRPLNQ